MLHNPVTIIVVFQAPCIISLRWKFNWQLSDYCVSQHVHVKDIHHILEAKLPFCYYLNLQVSILWKPVILPGYSIINMLG